MGTQRRKGARKSADGHDDHRGTALMLKEEDERRRIFERISEVRAAQVTEGMFDCFGKASAHYVRPGGLRLPCGVLEHLGLDFTVVPIRSYLFAQSVLAADVSARCR